MDERCIVIEIVGNGKPVILRESISPAGVQNHRPIPPFDCPHILDVADTNDATHQFHSNEVEKHLLGQLHAAIVVGEWLGCLANVVNDGVGK
jgi:hypothetical protein